MSNNILTVLPPAGHEGRWVDEPRVAEFIALGWAETRHQSSGPNTQVVILMIKGITGTEPFPTGWEPLPDPTSAGLDATRLAKLDAQPNAITPGTALVGGRTYVYGGGQYIPPANITYPTTAAIDAAIADSSLPAVGSGGGTGLTPAEQAKLAAQSDPITLGTALVAGQTYAHNGKYYKPPAAITYTNAAALNTAIANGSLPEAGALSADHQAKLDADSPLKTQALTANVTLDTTVTTRYKLSATAEFTVTLSGGANAVFVENASLYTQTILPSAGPIELTPFTSTWLFQDEGGNYLWPE